MDNRPIGIFDSGVGGLSILSEIQRILPNESFIFVADQAYVPYGKKTKVQLVERAGRIIEFFQKNDVKAVVVACNTATVYTIDEMRKKFSLPIIGTVPVIKTIAKISKSKKTAVFSTPATAESKYLSSLIKKFAKGVVVYKVGETGLEELIEDGRLHDKKIEKILYKSLIPLVKDGVDVIALGCTHYPFLREKIQKIVGKNVKRT
jgi:glutamate racemase